VPDSEVITDNARVPCRHLRVTNEQDTGGRRFSQSLKSWRFFRRTFSFGLPTSALDQFVWIINRALDPDALRTSKRIFAALQILIVLSPFEATAVRSEMTSLSKHLFDLGLEFLRAERLYDKAANAGFDHWRHRAPP
jgi:hypothetical protein